jgi:hypothetical protein
MTSTMTDCTEPYQIAFDAPLRRRGIVVVDPDGIAPSSLTFIQGVGQRGPHQGERLSPPGGRDTPTSAGESLWLTWSLCPNRPRQGVMHLGVGTTQA